MGKSTLLNALVGEKMSIITSKPQTTRHRIIGILNDDAAQIVFSDTPGFIEDPAYKMHQLMNTYIHTSFEDADVILFVTDPFEPLNEQYGLLKRIAEQSTPILAIINKIDLVTEEEYNKRVTELSNLLPGKKIYPVSALKNSGLSEVMKEIKSNIPEGPPFYPKDQLTDRPDRSSGGRGPGSRGPERAAAVALRPRRHSAGDRAHPRGAGRPGRRTRCGLGCRPRPRAAAPGRPRVLTSCPELSYRVDLAGWVGPLSAVSACRDPCPRRGAACLWRAAGARRHSASPRCLRAL